MNGEPGQSTSLQSRHHLTVEVLRRSDAWDLLPLDAELETGARAAYSAAGVLVPGEVAVVLSDDDEVRALNRTWAGRDKPTDVLSFPAGEPTCGDGSRVLGDIILAYETIERDARELGVPLAAHATHLVVHGLLHLLGYDHAVGCDADAMEGLETRILADLGLHDPYARDKFASEQ